MLWVISGDTLARLLNTLSGRGQPVTKSHLIQNLAVPKLRTLHMVGKMPSNRGNAGRACAKVLRQGMGNQGRM